MKIINKLLLVDDDQTYTFLTSKTIEKTQLVKTIDCLEDGAAALVYLEERIETPEELPDIILLDISMPILDGWQFLEDYVKIKNQLKKEICIYMCSSSISPDDIAKAKSIPEIKDFVIKPLTSEGLTHIIENHQQ